MEDVLHAHRLTNISSKLAYKESYILYVHRTQTTNSYFVFCPKPVGFVTYEAALLVLTLPVHLI